MKRSLLKVAGIIAIVFGIGYCICAFFTIWGLILGAPLLIAGLYMTRAGDMTNKELQSHKTSFIIWSIILLLLNIPSGIIGLIGVFSESEKDIKNDAKKYDNIETSNVKKDGYNTKLFIILLSIIFLFVILSWFLKASYFDAQTGSLIALKDIFTQYYGLDLSIQIGFFDIFKLIFAAMMYFYEKFIFILSVGAFYGVLSKTGKYRAWIDKIAEKFKGNEKAFLITVSVVLLLISSLTNYGLLFLIIIPLLIGIVIALGYDKITAFITTFGAVILGELGSTLGYNITVAINNTLETTFKTGLGYKIGLLVFGIVFLVIYILKAKHSKVDTKEMDELVGEKSSNKYSVVSLIVVLSVIVVLLVLGCTYWSSFVKEGGTTFFEKIHNKIMATKVAKMELFKNLNGTYNSIFFASNQSIEANPALAAFGYWGLQEMSIILLLASLLIGRLYRIKHSDILNSMVAGVKKFLVPALLVLFTHVILLVGQYYYPVIAEFILNLSSKFNVLLSSFTMMIGTLFNFDMQYITGNVLPQVVAHGGNTKLLMLMVQSIYGVVSLIAPTSLMLIVGLSYLDIPYCEYIKKMWKYILILLAVVIAFLLILSFIL